eukprot:SAG25_NODE_3664_length_1008_cov_1.595160_1_plen_28_part_10
MKKRCEASKQAHLALIEAAPPETFLIRG